ncbi:MAG: septum formation initiator family protein [Clostridiales Family XIII bacterium]|jgi:cell division protein FtsB|nr:septum formation initiator family protein [Clostridiales Family XIII bacterium]
MARKRDVPREESRVIDINEVRDEKQARRSFVTGRRLVIIVAVAVLAVFAAVSIREIQDLRREAETAKTELKLKEEQKANLEVELARLKDPGYLEKQARDRLRMVKDDEIIYIYKKASSSNSVDETKTQAETPDKVASPDKETETEGNQKPDKVAGGAGE